MVERKSSLLRARNVAIMFYIYFYFLVLLFFFNFSLSAALEAALLLGYWDVGLLGCWDVGISHAGPSPSMPFKLHRNLFN